MHSKNSYEFTEMSVTHYRRICNLRDADCFRLNFIKYFISIMIGSKEWTIEKVLLNYNFEQKLTKISRF